MPYSPDKKTIFQIKAVSRNIADYKIEVSKEQYIRDCWNLAIDEALAKETPGYFYICKGMVGYIKIGRTIDLTRRLKEYNSYSPIEMKFIIAIRYPSFFHAGVIESNMKTIWAPYLARGQEWFLPHPTVAADIQLIKTNVKGHDAVYNS